MTPQILQCQSCGNYKHVSFFMPNGRICQDCAREGKVYQPFAITPQQAKMDEHLRRAVKAIIAGWTADDTFPEEITAGERKVIRRRALDMVGIDAVARELGVSEKRARAIEERAQAKLLRLAKDHAALWLMSSGDAAA